MIQLSDTYKANIIKMFGEIGERWLKKIPHLVSKYVKKYKLTNVELLGDLTYNILFFANSVEYGPVVLKLEIPFKELTIRESEALLLNDGIGACKCYSRNIEDGVLLLERLSPGVTLSQIDNLKTRCKIFYDVANRFNIEITKICSLPTYSTIFDRSLELANSNIEKYQHVITLLCNARKIFKELQYLDSGSYLLHSDLFAENILQTDNGWKAIDPHGFIGNKICDTAIFMQKELEKKNFEESFFEKLMMNMHEISGFNIQDLKKMLFVNQVLNICWSIESNIDEQYILTSINNANKVYQFIDKQ